MVTFAKRTDTMVEAKLLGVGAAQDNERIRAGGVARMLSTVGRVEQNFGYRHQDR